MTGILNGHTGIGNGASSGTGNSTLATTTAAAAHASPGRDASDAQMEQIRDLLFGSVRDELTARFDDLERRVRALEVGLADARRADATERRAAFDALATGVSDLSAQIRQLAKP